MIYAVESIRTPDSELALSCSCVLFYSSRTASTMSFAARSCARVLSRRSYATVADAGGVKVASASESSSSPTGAIAVVVKAGSRFEPQPGLAHVLKHSLFKVSLRCPASFSHSLVLDIALGKTRTRSTSIARAVANRISS